MNLIKEKQKIKEQIDMISDEEFLKVLKDLISYARTKKFSTPLTLDKYNLKLQESETAYEKGKTVKHKDVLKAVENWKSPKK